MSNTYDFPSSIEPEPKMTKPKPDDLDLIMLSIQDYNLKHKGEEQLVLDKRGQWQPIETAPKDGSSVLLYEDFEPAICAGYWGLESEEWRTSRSDGFWRQPTHWMPLPAEPRPPAAKV